MFPCVKRWLISRQHKVLEALHAEWDAVDLKIWQLEAKLADEATKLEAKAKADIEAELVTLKALAETISNKRKAVSANILALVKKIHL